jgi:hypothetical protein
VILICILKCTTDKIVQIQGVFLKLNSLTTELNLHQLVNFLAWSRTIKYTPKESDLDHIYVIEINMIVDYFLFESPFGDQLPVANQINQTKEEVKSTMCHGQCFIQPQTI